MKSIEAAEIKALARQRDSGGPKYPWEAKRIREKFDGIANALRYGETTLVGENGADSDEALALLHPYGEYTALDYYFNNLNVQMPEQPPLHVQGMVLMGLPDAEVERLAISFAEGKIPADVLDAVVNGQEQIQKLHPDQYPFEDTAYDLISSGLSKTEIDTGVIWQGIEENLLGRDRADLALMYGYGSPTEGVIGIIAHYALTKQDITQLNATKREVHF